MNFLPGTLERDGDTTAVVLEDGTRLAVGQSRPLPPAGKVTVGIRPEHLLLGAGPNALTGRVEVIEQTGAQNHLKIRFAGALLTAVDNSLARVNADANELFHVDPEHIYLFGDGKHHVSA